MSAFIDGRCHKCDKRMGWVGEMSDRPKCPRCGADPPPVSKADEDELESLRKTLEIRERIRQARKKCDLSDSAEVRSLETDLLEKHDERTSNRVQEKLTKCINKQGDAGE